jgi:tetratricopeptide (TPR) repeat protein
MERSVVKLVSFFGSLVAAAALLISLNSCANAGQPEAQMQMPMPHHAQANADGTLAGNYLAGRFAQRHQDWESAQDYMNRVMNFDVSNELLRQRAFLLTLGAQQYPKARELALKIANDKEGAELSWIYLACDALTHDDYKTAEHFAARLPDDGFGQYTKPLLTAWAYAGEGRKDEALKLLQAQAAGTVPDHDDPDVEADSGKPVTAPDDGTTDATYNIHAGLMEELAGNTKAAGDHYKVAMENGLTLHTALIVANYYRRNGHPETAKSIYSSLGKLYAFNPFSAAITDAKSPPDPAIARPADGAAVALMDLATLLFERRAYDSAQIYGSMVLLLSPKSPFGAMMMGDIAALNERYETAIAEYQAIPPASPLFWLSRMRMAEVYEAGGKLDDSVKLLSDLAKAKDTRVQALTSLGDLYRRHEQFQQAFNAYDQALATVGKVTEDEWPIVYARGMSLERLNNWTLAEKDLLTALKFQPDNPMILNFIGYSWVDKGVNVDKGLDFIRRAVAQRPDDGYILDSYGWALYRMGNYKEAVVWMEKAIGFIPDDSTMLDHLGDAYWQMGRRDEARFKWRRAVELSKDTAFRAGLALKIQHGMTPPSQVAHKEANL